jgi:hypothetical protein
VKAFGSGKGNGARREVEQGFEAEAHLNNI